MPSPRQAHGLIALMPEVLAFARGKGLDAPPELVEWVLMRYDDTQRAWRSERATQALRERRLKGVRYTRHAGYGWRWSGRRGRQRRVPDEAERKVVERIIAWWAQGYSWYEIARHLMLTKVNTAEGREWSVARVRRAYRAAIDGSL
jgi:hypothetical protein